ncbi:hypothetical protein BLA29_012190 [Euroglyphus maynei]|uniref:Uncharacterized protein n=1 Tax=Euroglyphus maynei TaxID=6958 RepID=A0A1Y3ATM4_EURMA|nr:hypothetical protein BLA29_012190 [Euroglyphus maynei]
MFSSNIISNSDSSDQSPPYVQTSQMIIPPPISPTQQQQQQQQQSQTSNPLHGSPLPPRYRFRELLMGATTDIYNTYADDGERCDKYKVF